MMIRLLVPVMFVYACSKPAPSTGGSAGSAETGSASDSAGSAGSARPNAAEAAVVLDTDPCSADQLGLTGAKKLSRKLLRSGCRPKESAPPQLLTSEEQFTKQVDCTDKATGASHNWSAGMLVVATRSPSPAEAGVLAYDDGKVITFVSMQRTPCPDDPRPMPGPNETHVFIAEPNGARTFADRACTVQRACP